MSVSWISKTGVVSPAYYEKDGKNFLRGFFGGLVTTCGLKNIGRAYGEMGLHGRISNTPAENISKYCAWEGVIGLEPITTSLGGENIEKNNKYVILKPFEEYKTELKFSFSDL